MTDIVERVRVLVASWEADELVRGAFFDAILKLVTSETIDDIVAALPADLREEFVEHIRDTCAETHLGDEERIVIDARTIRRPDEHLAQRAREEALTRDREHFLSVTLPTLRRWLKQRS